jgi:hypothetical protein
MSGEREIGTEVRHRDERHLLRAEQTLRRAGLSQFGRNSAR